jgi:hypothetical protein
MCSIVESSYVLVGDVDGKPLQKMKGKNYIFIDLD